MVFERMDMLELRLLGKKVEIVKKNGEVGNKENSTSQSEQMFTTEVKKEEFVVPGHKSNGSSSSSVTKISEVNSNSRGNEVGVLLKDRTAELKILYENCRKALEYSIRRNIHFEKKIRKRKIEKNNIRLGEIVSVRKGVQFSDDWLCGKRFKKLERAIKKNHKQRDELEKRKKNLTKELKAITSTAQDSAQFEYSEGLDSYISIINNKLEAIRLEISTSKKEETDINQIYRNLDKARKLHIQMLKMASAEESSKYKGGNMLGNNKYMLMNIIGKGGFSEVHKAFDFERNCLVACKLQQISSDWLESRVNNYIKHALRENTIHRNMNHPNIVQMYNFFEEGNAMYVSVMEYCATDLGFRLQMQKFINERDTKVVIAQVLSALKYMNEFSTPIIHYDLKPANILFPDINSWSVKLTDFGLSKIMPRNIAAGEMSGMDLTSPEAGTFWYLPPECFSGGKSPPKISSKVDSWSVGIICFEMIYGSKPFCSDIDQKTILHDKIMLTATNVSFPAKPVVSPDCKKFILRALTYSKEERPDPCMLAMESFIYSKKSCITDKNISPVTPNNRHILTFTNNDSNSN